MQCIAWDISNECLDGEISVGAKMIHFLLHETKILSHQYI